MHADTGAEVFLCSSHNTSSAPSSRMLSSLLPLQDFATHGRRNRIYQIQMKPGKQEAAKERIVGKLFGIGSGFQEAGAMKHSGGSGASVTLLNDLLLRVGQEPPLGQLNWVGFSRVCNVSSPSLATAQVSLHLPVHVRGVGPADGASAIGLKVSHTKPRGFSGGRGEAEQ